MTDFQIPAEFDGFLWLLLLLGPYLIAQRSLHREIQLVFLALTRRTEIALSLFSLLFFPGVLLHESSHFVAARLLNVRTGRISLLPRPQPNGRLQLGFVETANTDWLRDAIIGAAPLIAGGVFVAYAGLTQLRMYLLWDAFQAGGIAAAWTVLPQLYAIPDFWIWFYLAFTISATMLPSASDRQAWGPLVLVFVLLMGLSLLVGAGPWLVANVAPYVNRALRVVAVVIAIGAAIETILLLPVWLLRVGLLRLTGLQIVPASKQA